MSERALTSAGFEGPDLNEGHSGHSEPLRTRPPRIPENSSGGSAEAVGTPGAAPRGRGAVEALLRVWVADRRQRGSVGSPLVVGACDALLYCTCC